VKVLLLARYGRLGASSRIRSYQYLDWLRASGIDVTTAPLLDDEYLGDLYAGRRPDVARVAASYVRRIGWLLRSAKYDLVWIEKEVLPWLPAWPEWFLNVRRVPYVVDYDDAIFHRYDQHPNPVIRAAFGGKINAVMRRAAAVIAGNEYLAGQARAAGARHIEVIPTVVDLNRYEPVRVPEHAIFSIGWIGSPMTSKYLRLVRNALAEVCAGSRGELVIVGDSAIDLDGVPCRHVPWTEESEVGSIQTFDVGIMPLLDEPWERGKCGYKLIQYMACRKPVIASPVGANRSIVKHGVTGFLASSEKEWTEALIRLRDDVSLRTRTGAAGRADVERRYCTSVTAPRLADVLFRAAGGRL
jgi:glycosyltransferase involved in cell wall biosynthesis